MISVGKLYRLLLHREVLQEGYIVPRCRHNPCRQRFAEGGGDTGILRNVPVEIQQKLLLYLGGNVPCFSLAEGMNGKTGLSLIEIALIGALYLCRTVGKDLTKLCDLIGTLAVFQHQPVLFRGEEGIQFGGTETEHVR